MFKDTYNGKGTLNTYQAEVRKPIFKNIDNEPYHNIEDIRIDQVDQLNNIRSTYKEEEVEEMMRSLKADGLLSPIKVSPLPNGRYELVYGNMRLTSLRKLGMTHVSAIVEKLTPFEILKQNFLENDKRSDNTCAEQGLVIKKMMEIYDMSIGQVGVALGKDKKRIRVLLDIVSSKKIPDKYRNNVIDFPNSSRSKNKGKIPSSIANQILSTPAELSDRDRDLLYEKVSKDDKFSAAHVRNTLNMVRAGFTMEEALAKQDKMEVLRPNVVVKKSDLRKYPSKKAFLAAFVAGGKAALGIK